MNFRLLFALFLACIISSVQPPASAAQGATLTGAFVPELMGRWDVAFRSPQANVDTMWVIEPAGDVTSIGTLGLNTAGVAIRNVAIEGTTVTMTGTSSAGPLVLTGRMSGDRLEGRFTAGPIAGTFNAIRRADSRTHELADLFDRAVQTFVDELFTSAPFDQAWYKKRDAMRAELQKPEATERDMVRAVRTLLAAARLSHLEFYIPVSTKLNETVSPPADSVLWRRLDEGLGFIRIETFVDDASQRVRLDQAFADLGDTSGLIIDLIDNPGGDLGLAARLGDHLLPVGSNGGQFATRKGLQAAAVTSMDKIPFSAFEPFDGYRTTDFQDALTRTGAVRLITGGRAPAYAGRVALLINGNSASSSEAVAAMMKETGRARLFGVRSAGKMLSSRKITLDDGYVLRLPYADFRTPKGAVVESVGVNPDQTVTDGNSAVRTAAITWLSRQD